MKKGQRELFQILERHGCKILRVRPGSKHPKIDVRLPDGRVRENWTVPRSVGDPKTGAKNFEMRIRKELLP
jgi:hypothetical protein